MDDFEAELSQATHPDCDPKSRIPGAVVTAATFSGRVYSKCAGVSSLVQAAMQCVEQGLISLDEDIRSVLPELKDAKILEVSMPDKESTLRPVTGIITLRMLLTHSAGFGYDIRDKILTEFNGGTPKAFCGDFERAFARLPLLYEPGQGWSYSAGLDWAGKIIERLQGRSNLGQYMEERIWKPLGMNSTTFRLEDRPDLEAKLATMSLRTEKGIEAVTKPVYARMAKDDSGGAGAYSTASDILKLLTSLLLNDGKVLKAQTVDQCLSPQLSKTIARQMEETVRHPVTGLALGSRAPNEVPLNHGLIGLMLEQDAVTGRRAGTIQWAGYPNLYWWIDQKGGRCGVYCSQLTPTKDPSTASLVDKFEQAVYSWGT